MHERSRLQHVTAEYCVSMSASGRVCGQAPARLRMFIFLFGLLFPTSFSVAQSVASAASASAAVLTSSSPAIQTVVFIGDSITQGYGVRENQAYPEIVQHLLQMRGHAVRVINGGISGSVTADADKRLKWYLRAQPQIVVLELGGNDFLKGTPPEVIKKNLSRAIDLAQSHQIKILLCGMDVFTNLGDEYRASIKKMYEELAREKKVPLMPFLLENVALHKDLMQADQKHPNVQGHVVVAKDVATRLEKLL